MASITPRTLKDGTIVWDVKWRLGGTRTGGQKTETFNPKDGEHRGEKHALAFKAALEANRHRWPANYLPGIGYVTEAQYAAAQAAATEPDREPLLFADHAAAWLKRRSPGLESGTVADYTQMIAGRLNPWFGHLDVTDPQGICEDSIAAWITDLRDGKRAEDDDDDDPEWERPPLSAKTIRNFHGLLSAIMQALVDAENPVRTRNPCAVTAKTSLPALTAGAAEEEMVFLSPEEYAAIHWHLGDADPDAQDLADFLVGTGLRFSEATALQPRDFSLATGGRQRPKLRVRRAWKQAEDGSFYLGDPKTDSSIRTVYLDERQVEMLRPRLAGKTREALVFVGPSGRRWTHATFYTGRWWPAVYKAMRCIECRTKDYAEGIGRRGASTLELGNLVWCGHEGQLDRYPRIHDLRHTHVGWLIASGAPLLAVSKRLGHASINITYDRYGHLLEEVQDDLLAGLSRMMERLDGPPRLSVVA